ncbi:DUF2490 domain-containing protein [Flavobacterium sp. AG291]|uniref:DUF2490 domain-containing protein n=1 Tax=Flavobacterium sp. AG291 TaxID=2184000 RepID=UPI000E0AF687|nr:DUF2490 domain-containing protein [Flavobacterium sp. AG291]RDI10374.1 uncharacterized protein DUF2490 [Flavobacterium sp. AG291]
MTGKLHYIVCISFIMLSSSSKAQSEVLNQIWNEYAFTQDLSKNWVVELDGGLTSSSFPDNNNYFSRIIQVYFRGWAHYYPGKRWKVSFFYAHYFNKNVPELNQSDAPEYRFAFQVTYNLLKHHRININLRGRLEDRNIKNEELTFESVERLRLQAKAVYPLNGPKVDKRIVYAFLSDEVFLKTKSDVSGKDIFDRNRLTAGLGYPVTDKFQLELSYANEFLPRSGGNKLYNAIQLNVVLINLFSKAEKPFKREKTEVDEAAPSGGGS